MGVSDDLARRVRDYARDRANKPLFVDGGMCVSSAWLGREFGVDPRTIAAALRPHGIRPDVVEPGVRGYVVTELAAIRFDEPDPADLPERVQGPDAVERLSAGAGHDMTPALRAAGLL